MSPLNTPSKHQSSSTSASTSNEPTGAVSDEDDVSETTHSYYWSPLISPNHINQSNMAIDTDGVRRQTAGAINTDYESSAAEDFDESYTTSKYENAEFAYLSYARTNKLDKLQALLQAKLKSEINLDLNIKGQQKQNFSWSALHLACYFGHIQVVELLLTKKAFRDEIDINIKNNSGDTPLHKAVLTNRVQIVQLLLAHGADVLSQNCDGLSAKQLTKDKHILEMLEAAERADKAMKKAQLFKIVDNGDLKKLQDYLETLSSFMQTPQDNVGPNYDNKSQIKSDLNIVQQSVSTGDKFAEDSELISQMIDERGNTLLHLATMRGFKAICVYLLELGFDPYKKNNLGQSSIDLASYQLRQLFTTVKPANLQLKKLTCQRVTRFEGPLLKKVRILGWKQIYVVLENGVILLFNNRRDSINKSRRGYKYLESATCEPDVNDIGTFTVSFSDKSRATFLVSSDHLSSYASFKSSSADKDRAVSSGNQIELIRQKWIDSVRDHICYSTNFIKNGLKINDYDDNNQSFDNNGDLTTLNHLLPIDTIKSFIQEARAHYSILERHADSLCNLVQSVKATGLEESPQSTEQIEPSMISSSSTTTTGSRFLNLIRPSRQNRSNSINVDDSVSIQSQQSSSYNRDRKKNDNVSDFMQDKWHCLLFHLHLLVESTEKTKVSMDQALALMENQEQLRQNRIQDQEEKCRVLEDSLQALARDHHQLEKSLSMSQIYHSAGNRSISLSVSTDLNEYFDAFEDFDDAASRTLTPTSMPSDEDLDRRIHEVINDDLGNGPNKGASSSNPQLLFDGDAIRRDESTDNEQDDDLHSNCSALTVETVSEISVLTFAAPKQLDMGDASPGWFLSTGGNKFRTRLPSPMVPRDQVSIWSILKNCIGKELSKITMPVVFNEPLTMLQRACESIQYCHYLKMADECDDPVERMEYIIAFIVAGLSGNCHRIIKPFNPLLYETYELIHEMPDGSQVKAMSQQVSHHPPITAVYAESDNFIYNGSVNPKIKFWGRSVEVEPDGQNRIYLKRHKESYVFKTVSCSIHNVIVGKLWFEHRGPLEIKCAESGVQANLTFKQTGWFGASNDLHRFDGFIVSDDERSPEKSKLKFVYGKWSDYIKSVDYSDYEKYVKNNKVFKIPDTPSTDQPLNGVMSRLRNLNLENSLNNNSIPNTDSATSETTSIPNNSQQSISKSGDKRVALNKSDSSQSLDIPNSILLWRLQSQYLEEFYNFTLYTMRLNELTEDLAKTLPRTDSRFRQDVRRLEEGDLDGAANEKQRLEEKQRAVRTRDKRFKDPSSDFLWFDLIDVPSSKEKFWVYKGGYWESKCNQEKFPDLF